MDRRDTVHDKKECVLGITDRIVLHKIPSFLRGTEALVKFLKEEGNFTVSGPGSVSKSELERLKLEGGNDAVAAALAVKDDSDIIDIDLRQQSSYALESLAKHGAKRYGKVEPKKRWSKSGMCFVTFRTRDLAEKAYTKLDGKTLRLPKGEAESEHELSAGLAPHSSRTALKVCLKNATRVVHLSNLPWFVSNSGLRRFITSCGEAAGKLDGDSASDGGGGLANPVKIFSRYRDGYFIGRSNVTFASAEQATECVEKINGRFLFDRPIHVNWAHEFDLSCDRRSEQRGDKEGISTRKRKFSGAKETDLNRSDVGTKFAKRVKC